MSGAGRIIVVLLVVATAGCNGFLGGTGAPSPAGDGATPGETPVSTPTPTLTPTPTPSPTPSPTPTPTATPGPSFDSTLDTGAILVRSSDLDGTYTLSDDERIVRSEASDSEANELRERGMTVQHTRTFLADESSAPQVVVATVAVYEDPGAAREDVRRQVRNQEDSAERVELEGGTEGQLLTFQTDEGLSNTVLLVRRGNVVLHTLVSDSSAYHASFAEDVVIRMLIGIEQQQG